MERTNKQLCERPFAFLGKLASFMSEQKLISFVMDHLERCSEFGVQSLNNLPPSWREKRKFLRQSCENWLRALSTYNAEGPIHSSIEDSVEQELLTMDDNELIIDDIIMINFVRAQTLKNWISEYTDDVSVAMAIVAELDNFVATYNRIAFRRYSALLISNLEARNKTLRASNEKLKEFAGVVSHDLKAPLRKISTYVELILEDISQGDASKISLYVTKTKSATAKMSQLIDNLLTCTSLDDQHQDIDHCDLQSIVEEVIENLEPAIREKDATIVLDKLPSIRAVTFQMTQLFQNLLGNALKFCKRDVPPIVRISNHLQSKKGIRYLVIEIQDNCIGFRNEHSEKVFSIFSRLHSDYEGNGLGLSICKKIVENHGGSISVTSQEGVGSVFKIELPVGNNP